MKHCNSIYPRARFAASAGFTLLETLVALSVILTALSGIMLLASQSLHISGLLRNKIIAAQLAQEGIELARNIRDNNVHQGNGIVWDDGLCQSGGGGYPCDREISCNPGDCSSPLGAAVQFSPFSNRSLLLSPSGFYDYASGSNTGFVRKINFSQLSSFEIKYTITITWADGSMSVSGSLLDWRSASA